MRLIQRGVEALATIGQHGNLLGNGVALRADDNDLPDRVRRSRSVEHMSQHGANQSYTRLYT